MVSANRFKPVRNASFLRAGMKWIALGIFAVLCACDSATLVSEQWTAAPRILSGTLTPSQLATADYVIASATRNGIYVTGARAQFSDREIRLQIPNGDPVHFTITGYNSSGEPMWSGEGDLSREMPNSSRGEITLHSEAGLVAITPVTLTGLEIWYYGTSGPEDALLPPISDSSTNYATDSVPSNVTYAYIVATTSPDSAVVRCNGGSCDGLALHGNATRFDLVVSLAGHSTTYSIEVRRRSALVAHDSTLSSLSVSGATATPVFSASTLSYTTDSVAATTNAVQVNAVAASSDAMVTCNGGACSNVALGGTVTSIPVVVTNSGKTLQYSLTVLRKQPVGAKDSTLKSLSVSGATVSPAFDPGQLSYKTDSVSNATTTVQVNAVATSPSAQVTCNSGACASVALTGNATPVAIQVNNAGKMLEYSLTILRQAVGVAHDSSLASLSVAFATMSPAFSAAQLTYTTDSVAYTKTSVAVTATAKSPSAQVTCNGGSCASIPLTGTATPIEVKVVNAGKSLVYSLNILRKQINLTVYSTIATESKLNRPYSPQFKFASSVDTSGIMVRYTLNGTNPTSSSIGVPAGYKLQFASPTRLIASPWRGSVQIGAAQTFIWYMDSCIYDFDRPDSTVTSSSSDLGGVSSPVNVYGFSWFQQSSAITLSRPSSASGGGSYLKMQYSVAGTSNPSVGFGLMVPYNQLVKSVSQDFSSLDSITFTVRDTRTSPTALSLLRVNLHGAGTTSQKLADSGFSYGWNVELNNGATNLRQVVRISEAGLPSWWTSIHAAPPSPLPIFNALKFEENCSTKTCSAATGVLDIDNVVFHFN